jgi:hypothetical protein
MTSTAPARTAAGGARSGDRTVAGGPGRAVAAAPWLPAAAVIAALLGVLLATHTAPLDIVKYAAYLCYGVLAPGTLVFRSLRRTPHTLLEDLTLGFATGLCLELGAWAIWASMGLQRWLILWPLLVLVPYTAVPSLRRQWRRPAYARRVPSLFAWLLAAVCVFFLGYLYLTFLRPTAILSTTANQRVYLDLPFQLSIAAETKYHFPPHVPQVAEEPLHYHWFGFAHMGTASLMSGVDLPVIFYRLDIPVLCLAAVIGMAVAGWRFARRPAVGLVATALTFVVGEFNFTDPVGMPFGTLATFIVWGSPSMTYSWVLLIALAAVLAEVLQRDEDVGPAAGVGGMRADPVPALGPGVWVLLTLFAFASTGAKASSVPVALGAVVCVAIFRLVRRKRLDRSLLVALAIVLVAEVFANVVVYAGETHGSRVYPFWGMIRYYPTGGGAVAIAGIGAAYVLNMLLRLSGIPVLLWQRRKRLGDIDALLVGGMLSGLGAYLVIGHPGDSNQYFVRDGWVFGVIASAWAFVLLGDRLSTVERRRLAIGAGAYALTLCLIQLVGARPFPNDGPFDPLWPLLGWAGGLALAGVLGAVVWYWLRAGRPELRGRGGMVALTVLLLAGAPGLVMDTRQALRRPNGGAYFTSVLPYWKVDAARYVRDHSSPDDVVATNAHCLSGTVDTRCDSRLFWLSAYSERRVLVEGWLFAPRATTMAAFGAGVYQTFWDPALLRLNDSAIAAPTAEKLAELRDVHHVRWVVVDRDVSQEGKALATLATKVFDDLRVAVYRLD